MGTTLDRSARLIFGLAIFGFGIALMVIAEIGLAPWDVFHQGLSLHLPITIGQAVIATGVGVMLGWIPLRERPGIGTVANAVLVGVFVDLSLGVLPPALEGLPLRAASFGAGLLLVAIGSGFYIGSGFGSGPRDGLMTGLARRGVPIGRARLAIELAVLGVGWLLGGNVGIGTAVFAVGIGPLVQVFLEPLSTSAYHARTTGDAGPADDTRNTPA